MKGEWLRYCGTVGKPDGNREDKYQPEALRESGLLTERKRQDLSCEIKVEDWGRA
jgi:hypothetical protein